MKCKIFLCGFQILQMLQNDSILHVYVLYTCLCFVHKHFTCLCIKGGGGVQGKFFWSSRFELWAPQVPLIIRETFGEILGPRRPTVSEPHPAQKLGVKYSFPPDGPRGANGAPNCSSHHPDSSHIGFDGSRTNSLAVAAQNAIAEIGRGCLN